MPAITTVQIYDGSGTPVQHTFSPIGRDVNGVFWFEQTTPSPVSPLGAKRIGYKQTRVLDASKQLTGRSKVTYTISVPTLEALGTSSTGITPPPTLSYVEMARVEFDLAERSTSQERKDTRVLMYNLLANAMPISNIESLAPSY
jgi:hypothetical protein